MSAPSTATAAVLQRPGAVEVMQLPIPELAADDGLLRVEATGVCGSDVTAFAGGMPWELPCPLGHEVIGTIEALGPAARARWGLEPGRRVALEEYLPCGTCRACTDGHHQLCALGRRYGATSLDVAPALWGGYASYLYLHPQALVHPVPDGVSPRLAQLFIPISNGLYWVQEIGRCRSGDDVVVIGPGPHGLACVVAALEAGARTVTVVGLARDRDRLAVATRLGATGVVELDGDDAAVPTLIAPAAVVVNTAAAPSALELAIAVAGEHARIVQVGIPSTPATAFPVREVWRKALTITGVRGRPSRLVPAALDLIASGRHELELLCTHAFAIEDAHEALCTVRDGRDGVVRAVIEPAATTTRRND